MKKTAAQLRAELNELSLWVYVDPERALRIATAAIDLAERLEAKVDQYGRALALTDPELTAHE